MIGVVIVTHGQLGRELVTAAEMIIGEGLHIAAVSIGWHDDVNEVKNEIEKAITKVDQGQGALILTDMFGGTPSNLALSFLERNNIEIVTGVNLPMVVKLASQKEAIHLHEFAQSVCEQGKRNIVLASEFIK